MLRILEPGRHLRPLAFQQEDDLEHAVIWLRGEQNWQRGTGQIEVEDLKKQEIAGKLLSVHAELEAFRFCLTNEFLQLLPSRVDPEGFGRLGSAMRNSLSNKPKPTASRNLRLPQGPSARPTSRRRA